MQLPENYFLFKQDLILLRVRFGGREVWFNWLRRPRSHKAIAVAKLVNSVPRSSTPKTRVQGSTLRSNTILISNPRLLFFFQEIYYIRSKREVSPDKPKLAL